MAGPSQPRAMAANRMGKALGPWWQGCRTVRQLVWVAGEVVNLCCNDNSWLL